MTIEIDNFRKKYPSYNDIGDSELAGMLAKKYPDAYGDLPNKIVAKQELPGTHEEISKDIISQFEQREEPKPFEQVASLKGSDPVATGEPRPGAETISTVARPLISATAATAGAILGTGTAPGAGTLAGGGIGFAAGEELADKLDEFLGLRERQPLMVELKESASDIVEGAALEAGGQSILPIVGPAFKFIAKKMPKIPFTKAGAEKRAGEIIAANTTGGPLVAKNLEEANVLEDAMPGLKFSRGQATNDPSVIKFERSRARGPGETATQQAEQAAVNSRAIRKFIDEQKGTASIGEVLDPLAAQREVVETGVDTAAKGLEKESAKLEVGKDVIESGKDIRTAAKTGKRSAQKEAGKLFEDVPQFDIDSTSLGTKIDELSKPFSRVENVSENIPGVFDRTKELLKETGNKLTPNDLQGIRSDLTDQLREVTGGVNPNNKMGRRISGLIGEVDDVLKTASTPVKAVKSDFKEIYHGTDKIFDEFDVKKTGDGSIWFSDSKKSILQGKSGASGKGRVINRFINENDLKLAGWDEYDKYSLGQLQDKGFDGIKLTDDGITDYQIFKPDKLKAKSPKEDIGAAEKLKTAQQFFKKEVIGRFKSGSVGDILKKGRGGDKITNANVASRFFKPGPKGAESAQEFLNAIGGDKTARKGLEDYISQDLVNSATHPVTGEITEPKLKLWLAKHRQALKTLNLDKKFDSVIKARKELDKAQGMKISFDKSVASKMLNSDVDSAVKNAFASGSKRKAANTLMARLQGDKKAVSGLQNSVIDHIIGQAETTAVDAFNNPIVSMAGFEREFKKLKPAIDVVFRGSPEKLNALTKYQSALRTLQRGKASPIGGGSDTAENVLTDFAINSGLSPSRTVNIIKAVIGPFKSLSDGQVNALLNRAAFDPDFAYTMQMAAKGRPVDMIERRLKGHLSALGLRELKKETDK